jgi:hypothetical protein
MTSGLNLSDSHLNFAQESEYESISLWTEWKILISKKYLSPPFKDKGLVLLTKVFPSFSYIAAIQSAPFLPTPDQ